MSTVQINIASIITDQFIRRPPGYRPRGSGMRQYMYTAADCDCRYCLYRKHCDECTCFNERLYAGCIPYAEIIMRLAKGISSPYVRARMYAAAIAASSVRKEVNDLYFHNTEHKNRWHGCMKMGIVPTELQPGEFSKALTGALFLLTADRQLWNISKFHLYPERIGFAEMDIRGIGMDAYVMLKAARELISGEQHINSEELTDTELIDDRLFKLVINAFAVRRHGAVILIKQH